MTTSCGEVFSRQPGQGFGEDDELGSERERHLGSVVVNVCGGEAGDVGGGLGVEQHEQAGDPVRQLQRVVVQEPPGVGPAAFGVVGAADLRRLQAGLSSFGVTPPPPGVRTPHGVYDVRHVVQHECGHAAASWALGYPFDRIALSGPRGPGVHGIKGLAVKERHDWVIKACGGIADQQARGMRMRGSQIVQMVLGSNGDRFEIDDAATGQVAVRPSNRPAVQPGGDLHGMAVAFRAMSRDQAVPELISLWRESERFAAELPPAIDALAEAVMARGQLSYSEAADIAAAAMAGRPIPVLAPWLR